MEDENAFGLLISNLRVEDEEYALEPAEFVDRANSFRQVLLEYMEAFPIVEHPRALDLGHAFYLELAAGDQREDMINWLKAARSRLAARDFETVAALTYGGRWVPEVARDPIETFAGIEVVRVSQVSEPFRKALYVDAAAQGDETENDGLAWGAGVYVDTEAIEALGRTPKNAPTPLTIAGATFYRVAR